MGADLLKNDDWWEISGRRRKSSSGMDGLEDVDDMEEK
jgi:hypothetical protein